MYNVNEIGFLRAFVDKWATINFTKRLKFEEFEALPEKTDHISGRRIVEMEMESTGDETSQNGRAGDELMTPVRRKI